MPKKKTSTVKRVAKAVKKAVTRKKKKTFIVTNPGLRAEFDTFEKARDFAGRRPGSTIAER